MTLMASCKENDGLPNHETQITTSVATEDGIPVANAEIRVVHDYANKTNSSVQYAKTDNNGNAITSARSRGSVMIRTKHSLYYPTYEDEVDVTAGPLDYEHTPLKYLKHSVVVRKIINPISLFAKQNDTPFPEKEKWIGFDLEKADWVKPYGIGIETDVEFLLINQYLDAETINGQSGKSRVDEIISMHSNNPRNKQGFLDSRDEFFNLKKGTSTYEQSILFRMHPWQGTVRMRVPHENGGIFAEKDHFLAYSKSPQSDYAHDIAPEMRMPHQAPKEGYVKEHEWKKTSADQLTIDKKLGFFIKTRIKLDEKGNVISAHYAKFISDVEIDIRGRIKFTSYFNPTANDTNLEFDLKKNLFTDLKDLEKPYLP
jgi:hypothetical protein